MAIPAAVPVSISSRPPPETVRRPPPGTGSTGPEIDGRVGFLDRDDGEVGDRDPLLSVEAGDVQTADGTHRVGVRTQPQRAVGAERARLRDAAHDDVQR